eukprot:PhF_6_TR1415/c0_g1_i1/m.2472/K17428/MRPL47, NCM1; large subunit ribosomal protein L47
MRRSRLARGIEQFVDPTFIQGQRPKVPGGAWTVEILRNKSMQDLQQIWYVLIKERNKLLTMERHYLKHVESLGALPAPSRIDLVKDSIENVKKVLRERDDAANAKAIQIFEERLKKGWYRYPPGPQPPPNSHKTTSKLLFRFESKPNEDELRQLLSDDAIYESHKGIVSINIVLPNDVVEKKRAAHKEWETWRWATVEFKDYNRYNNVESVYDKVSFEIAPGVLVTGPKASEVAVPEPMPPRQPPKDNALLRVRWEALSPSEKTTTQLGHFPNITSKAPTPPGPRPIHPDEILGPWEATITFDTVNRASTLLESVKGLGEIGETKVLSVAIPEEAPEPFATQCPLYDEAKRLEKVYQHELRNPQFPEWHESYKRPFKKSLAEIVTYNWNNKVDYVEREARLTNRDLMEAPIPVDHTCGTMYQIPPWVTQKNEWDADIPRYPMEFEEY